MLLVDGTASVAMEIRRIRPSEGLQLRALRLRALADAPTAFSSTLAREQAFPESLWHERAAGAASGSDRATFIAADGAQWIGCATGLAEDADRLGHAPILVGMFVDSVSRGKGIGAALVEAVAAWAGTLPATNLYLWVTATNRPAVALYDKCGFTRTADVRPLPHTPSLLEILMTRALGDRRPSRPGGAAAPRLRSNAT
jgi:GNAT superfamily N-acetyltransferase